MGEEEEEEDADGAAEDSFSSKEMDQFNVHPGHQKVEAQDLEDDLSKIKDRRLQHMGIMTAVAIALHNFPEGLATFVATLADPSVGLMLAIAIGVHNIPEGMAVAVPVLCKSGSRWKAFGWGMLSGLTEPLGGIVGYLFLEGDVDSKVYGALF